MSDNGGELSDYIHSRLNKIQESDYFECCKRRITNELLELIYFLSDEGD